MPSQRNYKLHEGKDFWIVFIVICLSLGTAPRLYKIDQINFIEMGELTIKWVNKWMNKWNRHSNTRQNNESYPMHSGPIFLQATRKFKYLYSESGFLQPGVLTAVVSISPSSFLLSSFCLEFICFGLSISMFLPKPPSLFFI